MRAPNSLFFARRTYYCKSSYITADAVVPETLLSARCWLIDSAVAYVHKYTYACTLLLVVEGQRITAPPTLSVDVEHFQFCLQSRTVHISACVYFPSLRPAALITVANSYTQPSQWWTNAAQLEKTTCK